VVDLHNLNDRANFVGPPGDLRKVFQAGDPAPGLERGTVFDVSRGFGLGADLSDNATLLVNAWLSGPAVDETNDQAMWIGTRDHLELVWRKGMPAPGTEPGTTFAGSGIPSHNDAGEIALSAILTGDEMTSENDRGSWTGGVGSLRLLVRRGDPVPGFPPGTIYAAGGGGGTFNSHGESIVLARLEGPEIPEDRDLLLRVGRPGDLVDVISEGDAVPQAGGRVEIDAIGDSLVNTSREIFFRVKYRGSSIEEWNTWATFIGPYDRTVQTLRDGDLAPHLTADIYLSRVVAARALAAMNDVGDVVTGTEVTGPEVTEDNQVVVWFRDHRRSDWFPLIRSGTVIGARVLTIPTELELSRAYNNKTGGSDGQPQSLNDDGVLAIKLEFHDESHGVFLARLVWLGDADADADIDFVDFGGLQACFSGSDFPLAGDCQTFDFDEDGDVDLFDFADFEEARKNQQRE